MKPQTSQEAPRTRKRKSLATQFTWISMLMVTLAVLVPGTGLIWIAERTQEQNVARLQQQSADQLAQMISGYISKAEDRLLFFLENVHIFFHSHEQQKSALENLLLTSLPLYGQVTFLNREGEEQVKISRFHTFLPEELKSQAGNPAFREALSGKNYMGPVAFFENTGLLTVPMAFPLKTNETEVKGVLMAEVNVSHLWQKVSNISMGREGYGYLVDRKGSFVAYQKPAEVLKRYGEDMKRMPPVFSFVKGKGNESPAIEEYQGLGGEMVIGTYAPIPGTDWAVMVEQPVREAFRSIEEMQKYLFGVLLVAVLLAGSLGYFAAKRLIGPIRMLTEAAHQFASGNLESRFTGLVQQDEVGILAGAFKKMQRQLQDLYVEQTQKIRTLERMQKALGASEEKYRTILENIEDGYYELDLKGNFTFFNDSLCRTYGYSRAEMGGMNIRALSDSEMGEKGYAVFNRVYRTGIAEKGFQWNAIGRDGVKRSVEASVSLRKDAQGVPTGFRGIIRDITEKQILETQLQHAQKMESIGTLAGGVAHNFNNLLMGIMGYTSLMIAETEEDHPNYKRLKIIEKQVENASKLTGQLLGYAREGSYEVKPLNLNRVIREISETFRLTRREVSVHEDFSEGLYGIMADQVQIEQVLLNLFVNAADAMPGGGDLFLTTKNVTEKAVERFKERVEPGDYVLLTVRDTGTGMDAETQKRIFEPFFTTKGLARGTGLGLASAYGIVKGHKGYITVTSEPGNGTTFFIYLPATRKEALKNQENPQQPKKGRGTIMLVDDEETVLETGEMMLRYLGYEVILAESGQAALRLFKETDGNVDLILLDMTMPGMGGAETFEKLRKINGRIPVLLLSGYSLEGEAKRIIEKGCNAFMQKPFKLDQLSRKIEEIRKTHPF